MVGERVRAPLGVPASMRILPSDPSKPLVLVVDTVATATASAKPVIQEDGELVAGPNSELARYSDPEFLGLSAGLMLVALTSLALLRSRQGIG